MKFYRYTPPPETAAFTGGFDYNPAFGATSRFQTYEECAFGCSRQLS
jgi:hypothetical protein